ncbi:MAG: hypothetical protein ABR591_03405 [Candidatus Velthaea sp.]
MTARTAAEPDVTILIVPRERFSKTRRALESIYAHTRMPFAPVYDGNSLIRRERYLASNEARNLALPDVRTKSA